MVNRVSQFAAILLAASFAVEGMLAGVVHHHCHPLPVCATRLSGCTHAGHGQADGTEPGEPTGESTTATTAPVHGPHTPGDSPTRHDEGRCLACQFLAKHALPVTLPTVSGQVVRVYFVAWPTTTGDIASQLSLPLTRGPPGLI